MKGYVQQALTELEHVLSSKRHQGAPSMVHPPDFGSKIQYVYDDDGEPMNKNNGSGKFNEQSENSFIMDVLSMSLCNMPSTISEPQHQKPPPLQNALFNIFWTMPITIQMQNLFFVLLI